MLDSVLPAYLPARAVASRVHAHLVHQLELALARGEPDLAVEADPAAIEEMIDAAFWASLRREEGDTPRISLALVSVNTALRPMIFEPRVPLAAEALPRLS